MYGKLIHNNLVVYRERYLQYELQSNKMMDINVRKMDESFLDEEDELIQQNAKVHLNKRWEYE